MNEQKSSTMKEQQPVSGTSRRTFLAGVAGAEAVLGVAGGRAFAQTTKTITCNTFLDPGNQNDPRTLAQPQMIAAFEVSQPRVKALVETRGRMVNYSVIQTSFNQICGEAFQRMILRDLSPAAVAMEVRTRYADALAKS